MLRLTARPHNCAGMMERRLVVEFTKMSGAGNDFIVIDNRFYAFSAEELSVMAPRVCARREGIGADGILAMEAPASDGAHFRMRYYNADGTEGTMCGNGARCLARYAVRTGMSHGMLRFDTTAGACSAYVPMDPEGAVRLFVGDPGDWRPQQPVKRALPPEIRSAHYLWTGTEHAVCFAADVASLPVTEWGRAIRHDEVFRPQGANVNFVQVDGPERLQVRTYEKGVEAETLACGTGALASALTAHYLGFLKGAVARVIMPGGTLTVGLEAPLFLEGPAATIYRGSFEL